VTLSEKRQLHSRNVALLILAAPSLIEGAALAIDAAKRTQVEADAAGFSKSLHAFGLVADLLLYVNGSYREDSASHAPLGAFWKSLHALNRWGGDFRPKQDGNHYSIEHEGVK